MDQAGPLTGLLWTLMVVFTLWGCTIGEREPVDEASPVVATTPVPEGASVAAVDHDLLRLLPGVRNVTYAVAAPAAGRLLLIAEEALWVVHPEGDVETRIELPGAVCGLAVQGLTAAVSHDGFLSLVNLRSGRLERILQIHLPCGDVALSEGYAYVLIQVLSRQQVIQIPLAGGAPRATDVEFFGIGCRLTPHPDGDMIYVACNDTVGRIGLDAEGRVDGKASYEIRMDGELGCNQMWWAGDGEWAYAACGGRLRRRSGQVQGVFSRAMNPSRFMDAVESRDLSSSGRLPMQGVTSACEAAGTLAVIPAKFSPHRVHGGLGWDTPHLLDKNGERTLELFSHPRLRKLASLPVSDFPSGDEAWGKAVFCGLQGGILHVLVRDAKARTWGVWNVALPKRLSSGPDG